MNRRTWFHNALIVIADVPGAIWKVMSETIIGILLAMVIGVIALIMLLALVVLWAANVLAVKFGLPTFTYTEALALVVLCRILFSMVNINRNIIERDR